MSRPHSYVLAEIVGEHGWTRGAEIGVLEGATLFYLLDRFPALTMVGVDKWENIEIKSYSGHDLPPIGAAVRERALSYGERCRILHMDSVAAAAEVADGSLDFVFIDAFHSYESASADIRAWTPKVRPGGFVTGHDWHMASVARALDELLPGWLKHGEHVWTRERFRA